MYVCMSLYWLHAYIAGSNRMINCCSNWCLATDNSSDELSAVVHWYYLEETDFFAPLMAG